MVKLKFTNTTMVVYVVQWGWAETDGIQLVGEDERRPEGVGGSMLNTKGVWLGDGSPWMVGQRVEQAEGARKKGERIEEKILWDLNQQNHQYHHLFPNLYNSLKF